MLSPFDCIILAVRLESDGWRFHWWHPDILHEIPKEPPRATLAISFPTPEAAAAFFTEVLTNPSAVKPDKPKRRRGLMLPAPECDYYWPPPLETCVKKYEADLVAQRERQVPIRRVFVMGAGFSANFQFATSKCLVREVALFFDNWVKEWHHSDWFRFHNDRLQFYLDKRFPDWRKNPPLLNDFLFSFLAVDTELKRECLSNFKKSADPLELFSKGISWEANNCCDWITEDSNLPFHERELTFLFSFNVLVATYLLVGRNRDEVETPWAVNLFKTLDVADAIITFNWDVIPEALMMYLGKPFCRYDWTKNRTKIMKLHGSVDLLSDPNVVMRSDLEVNPCRFECITDKLWRVRTAEDVLGRTRPMPFGRCLEPTERYDKYAILVITPYDVEGYGFKLIQFNWRKTRTALERAKEIYVIGYSIPEEDYAFHSLVRSIREKWNGEVTVDVWNRNREVADRANTLFGSDRTVFHEASASEFRFH